MSKTGRVVCVLYFAFSFSGTAQVNDFGIWTSLSIKKKITRNLACTLKEDIRFYENASELGTAYTDAGVGYEWKKAFQFELHYRFISKKQVDDFYEKRERLYADLSYRYRFRPVDVTLRERYQSQFRRVRDDRKTQSPEIYLRSKLTVKANLEKRYVPFLSFEWNYQLNNHAGNEVDNLRYTAGLEYELNKMHQAAIYYMINREINVNQPVTDYILGLEYQVSF